MILPVDLLEAEQVWCWYFYSCEAYDRTVCPLIVDGVATPNSFEEQNLVNLKSAQVRNKLERAGYRLDYSVHAKVEQWSFEEWKAGGSDVHKIISKGTYGSPACRPDSTRARFYGA